MFFQIPAQLDSDVSQGTSKKIQSDRSEFIFELFAIHLQLKLHLQ